VTDATFWCERAVVGAATEQSVVVEISDGRIVSVTADSAVPVGATRLPGLVIPGMANAHSHAFHRALRGRTQVDRGSFWTWRDLMYKAAERLNPDNYRRLATATFAEMAMAGISAVGEFHYVHHQLDGTPYEDPNAMGHALIDAAAAAGIRITLLDTLYLYGGIDADGPIPPTGVQLRFSDLCAQRWAERASELRDRGGVRVGAAIHSVRAVDQESMREVAAWASRRGAPVHAHVSEQPAENDACLLHYGRTPTGVLAGAGVLGPKFTSVHGTHLTSADVSLYSRHDCTMCFCPTTERDLGDGIGPSDQLVESNVAISLGTDSHACIDMLEEARALELNERLRSVSRGIHRAEQLLTMATVAGHRSIGWDNAGTIAVGQRGDLVAVSLDSVRTAGTAASAALETAIFAAGACDITDVVVDGKIVVQERRHRSINVSEALFDAIGEVMGDV